MRGKKLSTKKIFNLPSNLWFWPFLASVFYWIGYSITKNIYLSTIPTKIKFNQFQANKEFPFHKNPSLEGSLKKSNIKDKSHLAKEKIMKKIIYLPSYKDSNIKLEINYSHVQNLKNQADFKNNHDFFAKETVKSLLRTLKNTKKTKSYKVEAD
tara:strand:- start:948 stop:1409 length:462 start_codon:yes stop_codon:yes gene_type:complete